MSTRTTFVTLTRAISCFLIDARASVLLGVLREFVCLVCGLFFSLQFRIDFSLHGKVLAFLLVLLLLLLWSSFDWQRRVFVLQKALAV